MIDPQLRDKRTHTVVNQSLNTQAEMIYDLLRGIEQGSEQQPDDCLEQQPDVSSDQEKLQKTADSSRLWNNVARL